MLLCALLVEISSAKKGSARAQCIRKAAGGAGRVYGVSSVKKIHDTLVVRRVQKYACVVQCVVRASCSEQFAWCVSRVDAGCTVRSQSRAVRRVCRSRRCALPRRGRRRRACAFVGGRSLTVRVYNPTAIINGPYTLDLLDFRPHAPDPKHCGSRRCPSLRTRRQESHAL